MPHVDTSSGARYHYELYGNGEEKVFLIMGFACCKTYWAPQIREILRCGALKSSAPRSNRYQICAYDSRGFGQSSGGSHSVPYSTRNLAVDAVDILRHLEWISSASPPALHVVGWSMGGMIAQYIAAHLPSPHRLSSVVLLSTSPGGHRADMKHSLNITVPTTVSAYIPRNLPPLAGLTVIRRILLQSFTMEQRIANALELHFPSTYLDAPYNGVWPITAAVKRLLDEEGTMKTAPSSSTQFSVDATDSDVSDSDSDAETSSCQKLTSADHYTRMITPLVTNRMALSQIYAHRSPFDRPIVESIIAFAHHLYAVFTHQPTPRELSTIAQYNPLVITGTDDVLIHASCSVSLAQSLQCPIVAIGKTGHMVHVQQPTLFADIIDKHFRNAAETTATTKLSVIGDIEHPLVTIVDYSKPQSTRGVHNESAMVSSLTAPLKRRLSDRKVSFSLPASHGRQRTQSNATSSSSLWSWSAWVSSLQSLFTFFLLYKLFLSLPVVRVVASNFSSLSLTTFLRPVYLLHLHLHNKMMLRTQQILSLLFATTSV